LVYPNSETRPTARRRSLRVLLAFGLIAGEGLADTKKLQFDKNTSEGQFLELVSLETDGARKIALLEQFLVLFPSNPTLISWVYSELQDRYRRAGQLDKALATGEKLLSLVPDDIETARLNLRLAETKGDAQLEKKWAAAIAAIAERLLKTPLPSDPDELKIAEDRRALARQFVVNSDHETYVKALGIKDPAQRIAALEGFIAKSPQNPYLDQIEIAEFAAYKETGDIDKTVAAAEKIIAHNDSYESALLFIAEVNFRRKKDPKRAMTLAAKFIERTATATTPEGMTDDQWAHTKAQNLALAHIIIGNIHFQSSNWGPADKALRAALPLVGDEQLRASILNELGYSNYQLQNALEAIKFYRLCAAIRSPFQEQAGKSILSIKSEYNLP
jgi:tetratricopeptide (TPR) repeat protein